VWKRLSRGGPSAVAGVVVLLLGGLLLRSGGPPGAPAQRDAGPEWTYEGPDVTAGTQQIKVTARGKRGERPVGAKLRAALDVQLPGPEGTLPVMGADGDWVIYNAGPGQWLILIEAQGYAPAWEAARRSVTLAAGENPELQFTLLRGGTVTGRLVDADTGKPIEGARLGPGSARSDADGRYVIQHFPPTEDRPARVRAGAEGYITQYGPGIHVEDEQTTQVPDIALRRGGWIVGQVTIPEEARQWPTIRVRVEVVRPPDWPDEMDDVCYVAMEDGAFRLGPLPAGVYGIKAELTAGKGKPVGQSWRGTVEGVSVRVGDETTGVAVPVQKVTSD